MLALPLLAFELWYGALAVIILNRIFDGLDGAMARYAKQSSSAGGYLDITLDFFVLCRCATRVYFGQPCAKCYCRCLVVSGVYWDRFELFGFCDFCRKISIR
nr:CDP-alcohol phosphatidyltransferase family protein [Psychrobacter sp. JCM 18901]